MDVTLDQLQMMSEAELQMVAQDLLMQLMFGGASRLSPVFMASMILIALALWLARRPGEGFWAWVFPRRVYRTSSFWVDVKLWITGGVLRALGLFSLLAFAPLLADRVQTILAGDNAPTSTWPPILIGLILFATSDFTGYWVHRIFHERPRLWPFHALHHSAEELNPVTVLRKHPVYDVFSAVARAMLIGLLQGLLLGLVVGTVDVVMIMGANLFYYAFNLAGANLRHTHIWLSWGPVVEHVLVSPAQHQIHHSINPAHFNKNYGEVLAIWDWMFGTLYVPHGVEKLEFGLADLKGRRIAQPHGTLRAALIEPFVASFDQAKRRKRAAAGRLEAESGTTGAPPAGD
ncbi:sterol desaturase family protein [Aliiroseovarius sp.]|uniref:sterol desaturase family protein n=1 Tax=Aliiroseovarius sp. TaxID=1872442 RepID=UPI003BAB1974